MERMQRRWKSLSAEEVQKIFDEAQPEQYTHGGLGGGPYMPPYSDALNGRSFTLLFEGEEPCRYDFHDIHSLTLSEGGASSTEYADIHEAEPGLFFVNHVIKGSTPPRVHTLVLDTNTGLVTLVRAQFGNGCEAREVSRRFCFGRIEGYQEYPAQLHHFTADLVGKAIYWTYHETGYPPIKHIYSTEYYYSYTMKTEDQCWMASNPADYVRINDRQVIFSFVEERQAGTQGLFLINTEELHDVGCFTGINSKDQFESYTVGAKGTLSTMETYFGL